MSERVCVRIEIGGDLPADKLAELMDAIDAEGVALEWGGPLLGAHAPEDLPTGAVLDRYDDQSRGTMGEIRAACQSLGLSYIEYADPMSECPAQLMTWYTPDMAAPFECLSAHDEPMLSLRELREVRDDRDALDRMLDRCTPPTLPPFRIVEPAAEPQP
jgi:hypothetical protein